MNLPQVQKAKMILYINSSETDYGQDILFAGLVQKLGRGHVLDWPFNINYFISRKPYPRNMGHSTPTVLQKINYMTTVLPKKISIDWTKIKGVIVGSCKAKAFKNYLQIISQIPDSVPTVFYDGGDYPEIAEHLFEDINLYHEATKIRPFDFILKREKLIRKDYAKNVHAFPFGANIKSVPESMLKITEKKYDVSFWAVESHPIRTQALKLIQDRYDCKANGTTLNQKFKTYKRKGLFYLEELKKCKVVLNFQGAGWDTLRYWEVPTLGNLLISEKPGIEIPNNFTHGENMLFCKSDLSDLTDLCDWALAHPDQALAIGQRAREHMVKYHSAVVRADEVLRLIRY